MKHTYKIVGMSCNGCKANVEKTLLNISGIIHVSVDLKTGMTEIEMNEHISLDKLQQEFLKAGLHYTISEFDLNEKKADIKPIKKVKGKIVLYFNFKIVVLRLRNSRKFVFKEKDSCKRKFGFLHHIWEELNRTMLKKLLILIG